MGSPYSFRRSSSLCIASTYIPYNINMILLTSTCLNTFPTAVSFLARGIVSYFFSRRKCFCLILMRKNDKSPYSFTRKNGDLHLLVRFGLRTKAAIFLICTHLSRVIRKAIVKNNFHCTLGEPLYHETPWRTYSQYTVIIYSVHRGTDS